MSFYFKIRTVEKEIICPLQPLKKNTNQNQTNIPYCNHHIQKIKEKENKKLLALSQYCAK